ncbi:hypothetical protein RB614_03990 [Phytohabitans sp. ZYX-F-186]|uniref:RCK C-terminal domain-containing protein n=1 Tax=Phytohabitans maris TaxID=3071409 RepID=A0ABU0Z9E6_9ACTN|nr:hypothetical protein [Phytohabitans sp. ZYX-F-186]MDQ7903676.1 hypothetical protein [Phytohabitans sp. ZYX-F-186]
MRRHLSPELTFGYGETMLVRSELPAWFAGRPLTDLEVDTEVRLVEVTREGRSFIPTAAVAAKPGDRVSLVVSAAGPRRMRALLEKEWSR